MSLIIKVQDAEIVETYGSKFTPNYKEGDKFLPFLNMSNINYFEIINPDELNQYIEPIGEERFDRLKNQDGHHRIVNTDVKTWFRYHRGSLADAMRTVVEVKDIADLTDKLIRDCGGYIKADGKLKIKPYGDWDSRINWTTHIVTWDRTVMGFLSGELK